jgi:hypothetical protein
MSRVSIPANAIRLLRLSPTFAGMASTLDNAYVDHKRWIELQARNASLKLNNALRVASGSLAGRRVLYVGYDPAGSLFVRGQSIESPTGWDIIRFDSSLASGDTIGWIQNVAHESAHAFARVTASGTGPATPVLRVRAAVNEECKTRRVEQKILHEIRATAAGRVALRGYAPRPVRTCDCERDWFPALQKRTYLEHFVLGMDWESAARKLNDADTRKVITDVVAIPLTFPADKKQPPTMLLSILRGTAPIGSFAKRFPVLNSPAGRAAVVLRIVDASWRQLIGKVGEGSGIWTGARDRRLERHRRLFFMIPVNYTACP